MRRVAAAAAVCSLLLVPGSVFGIAHGRDAQPGAHPWMATLFHVRSGGLLRNEQCGATLIAPDRLLTAAHCVEAVGRNQVRAFLGLDRISQPARRELAIAGFSTLPGYRVVASPVRPHDFSASATARDAALVLLRDPVRDVEPIPLAGPLDGLLTAPGAGVILLGHGRTTATGVRGHATDALREAHQVMLAPERCRMSFGALFAAGQVCALDTAQTPPAGACAGDSGGPLVAPDLGLDPVQIGIVIYGGETQGTRCEGGRYPDVYTEVAAVRAFAGQAHPPLAPFTTATPRVVRRAADGGRPRCLRGDWSGSGLRFRYRWEDRRRLSPDRRTFLVLGRGAVLRARAGAGARLACVVTATNRGGRFARSSRAVPSGPDG